MKKMIIIVALLTLGGCAQVDKALLEGNQMVAKTDRITGRSSINLYDRQAELAQGNQAAEAVIAEAQKKGQKLNEAADPVNFPRLERIMRRVHGVSHLRDETGWRLVLIDDPEFNAFVTGGNVVFVYTGLLAVAKTDDAIATVIGHEIAHIAAGHVAESGSFSLATRLANSKSARNALFQSSFTMQQEREADRVGILYTALAGYDPRAASGIWQKMLEAHGSNAGAVHTHPVTRERMSYMRDLAEQVSVYYTAGQVNPDFVAILDNNVLWQRAPETARTGVGATLETIADYYTKRERTKAEAQNQAQRIAAVNTIKSNLVANGARLVASDSIEAAIGVKQEFRGLDTITLGMRVKCANTIQDAISEQSAIMQPGRSYPVVFKFNAPIDACDYRNARLRVDDFR